MRDYPEVVLIHGGTFQMGSPDAEFGADDDEPLKTVTLDEDFYIGKFEVTVAQFRAFAAATGYQTENEQQGDDHNWKKPFSNIDQEDDHPVLTISWHDANAYCDWLSEETGDEYRLPTESEWEYACRAGTTTAFNTGDTLTKQDATFSNFEAPAEGQPRWKAVALGTTAVGSYMPNAFGLFDMHGNAAEWCSDFYGDSVGQHSGERYHVIRGGSWSMSGSAYCRSAHREGMIGGNLMMGFRVVKEAKTDSR